MHSQVPAMHQKQNSSWNFQKPLTLQIFKVGQIYIYIYVYNKTQNIGSTRKLKSAGLLSSQISIVSRYQKVKLLF